MACSVGAAAPTTTSGRSAGDEESRSRRHGTESLHEPSPALTFATLLSGLRSISFGGGLAGMGSVAGLAGELRDAVFPNAKIPFSGSFKSVTNTHQWTALGRVVKINNRATPTDYDDDEFSEYRSRPMSVIPTVHLKKASDILEYAERQRDRFFSLISEHPVDDRVHSCRELFSDERFMCAFRWAGLVGMSIDGLVSSFGTEVIGKAIGRDIEKIAGTIFACQGMLCGSVPSKSMADRIVLLVSSQDRTLPARILRRLTKGLRRLLSDELALRSEDMGNTGSQSRE